jgi:hypothetical protein
MSGFPDPKEVGPNYAQDNALDLAIDLYKIEKLLHEEIVEFNHNKELLQHKLEALSLKKNMVTPGFDSTSLR